MDDELEVWLEPGYDQGRIGAWMLAWPGCFIWASDRAAVLERAASAVGGHLDWLADHGEVLALLESGRPRVVEAVPAERDGAYERNACFRADHRPVDAELLDTLLRRARWAREDLLAIVARARALPDPDAVRGRSRSAERATAAALLAPRSLDEVLRHVGQAEVWFTSRLERGVRYDGPPPEGDLETYLTASRAWFEARIRDLQRREPAATATDGKGEAWTLFKVLRRYVYHGLDHLEELDRRLAIAEGRAARLEWRRGPDVPVEQLARLLILTGRARRARDRQRLASAIRDATDVVSAWDGDRLVAFARSVHDGVMNGYVSMVYVHPRWHGRGVGTQLMARLLDGRDEVRFVLHNAPGTESFYAAAGFEPQTNMLGRPGRAPGPRC
jgi:GNAT superfamily N-acetyltransferase